ncbi:MAG: hypothetical protein Q8K26_03805 [Candidatus Gracilibacteria bacterium]|nr:hypothetical protein [Candidatus Gracilibacteria bacterium]
MYTAQKDMKSPKTSGNISSLLILVLSIALAFFFTRVQYYQYMENKDTLASTTQEMQNKKNDLEALQLIAKNIEADKTIGDNIERFAGAFREDVVLDSLFIPTTGVSISNVTMNKGEKLPNGLSEASISLSFQSQDITTLNNFLEYLTAGKTNKKSYVIKNMSFPLDTTKNEPIASTVELGMFYLD